MAGELISASYPTRIGGCLQPVFFVLNSLPCNLRENAPKSCIFPCSRPVALGRSDSRTKVHFPLTPLLITEFNDTETVGSSDFLEYVVNVIFYRLF
jgi:hypothetical protein